MPSWNIHTAHVERLLSEHDPMRLGVEDPNAFLFGNYVPDIYVGYMVPDATMRIDYRISHVTPAYMIPTPDADGFWDGYLLRFLPKTEAGFSLLLGAWAHLYTDRFYNGRMRAHCVERHAVIDDALRVRKQGDFHLFGRSLSVSAHVEPTEELFEAAFKFPQYRILHDDVVRAIQAADKIVDESEATEAERGEYRELSAGWMSETFDGCNERLSLWLETWMKLGGKETRPTASDIRREAGLPSATPDSPDWMKS